MQKNRSFYQRGVTIAELAIVILIIGILLGIVSQGIKLRQASELRGFMSDVGGFRVAIEGFLEKYRDLPGDISDASSYWGAACDTTIANCNGNGDGSIRFTASSTVLDEYYRAWQHLNLAGFIEGSYTGLAGSTDNLSIPGVNVPGTKRSKGGYVIMTRRSGDTGATDVAAATIPADLPIGTLIRLAAFDDEGAYALDDPIVTPAEAYAIDKKMDDGAPDAGKVQGRYGHLAAGWQTTTCLSGTSPNRTYATTRTATECVMFFDIKQ
jgi:prepilin-type N-terminal cleavage/methylation domain-containing protein